MLIEAYVDGSYLNNVAGYGFVMLLENEPVYRGGGVVKNPKARNIDSELVACAKAVKWAIDNDYWEVRVYYDYAGIEKWVTGEWNANKAVSREYVKTMRKLMRSIAVYFVKVKGHSGDFWNDEADKLAKEYAQGLLK